MRETLPRWALRKGPEASASLPSHKHTTGASHVREKHDV